MRVSVDRRHKFFVVCSGERVRYSAVMTGYRCIKILLYYASGSEKKNLKKSSRPRVDNIMHLYVKMCTKTLKPTYMVTIYRTTGLPARISALQPAAESHETARGVSPRRRLGFHALADRIRIVSRHRRKSRTGSHIIVSPLYKQ